MVGKAQKSHWTRSESNSVWIGGSPSGHPPYSPDLGLGECGAVPTLDRELRGKKFRSDQRSAAPLREGGGAL
jgi:hypothetical protein